MKERTIAIVANSTWNIYNFRLNVIDRFLELGYNIVVLAPIDEYIEYREKYPKVKHINLRMLDRDSTNPIVDLLLTLELKRKYKRINPDLILHYTNKPNIYGGVAVRSLGIPSLAVVTGLGYAFINNGLIRNIIVKLYRYSSRYHQRFIFENIEDRVLFERLNILPNGKGVSIKGCGVNTTYFYHPRKTPIAEKDFIVFTFIGRLLYDKGIREFVEAANMIRKEYSNVQFGIVGELDPDNPATMDKEELNHWIEDGVIEYHGFKRDVRPYIIKSSCVVLPSYREAIPRTITESMSMGTPVITTDVAGCREAVEPGKNGYLVKVRDPLSLFEAMKEIIALSPAERRTMGEYGRQKALKEFDDKLIAKNIVDLCEEVIHANSNE